jgi:hypothetical protein
VSFSSPKITHKPPAAHALVREPDRAAARERDRLADVAVTERVKLRLHRHAHELAAAALCAALDL